MLIEFAIVTGAVSVGRAAWRRIRRKPTAVTVPPDPPTTEARNPHRTDMATGAGALVLAGVGQAMRSTPLGLASAPLTLWAGREQFSEAYRLLVEERRTSFALVDSGLTIIAFATGAFVVAAGNTLLHTVALALSAHESAQNRRAAARPTAIDSPAWLVDGPSSIRLRADDARVADTIELRPGDAVPADGRIVAGAIRLDARVPAGHLGARDRGPGDAVADGNRVVSGLARVRVEAAGAHTRRRQLASPTRPTPDLEPSARRVDRIADASVGFTLPTAVIAGLFGGAPTTVAVLGGNLFGSYRISGPAALQMHLAALREAGAEVPDGRAFEALAAVDRVCIELTALLEPERLIFDGLRTGPHIDGETCLSWAAALLAADGSAAGDALAEAAAQPGRRTPAVLARASADDGVESGWIDGQFVELGPGRALRARGVRLDPGFDGDRDARARNRLMLAIDGLEVAALSFEHALRPGAEALFAGLQTMGIEPMLLTVEAPEVGDRWTRRLGIARCWSELDARDRAELIDVLRAGGHAVAYLGAGPLDRRAMAAADVTLVAQPVDASARAAADIVLTTLPLSRVPELVDSARRYHRQQGRTIALMTAGTGVLGFSTLVFGLAPLTTLALQFVGLGAGLSMARPAVEPLMALPEIEPTPTRSPTADPPHGELVAVPS